VEGHIKEILYTSSEKRERQLAVLIDPDHAEEDHLDALMKHQAHVHYYFIGGSMIHSGNLENTVEAVRKRTTKPILLFPGADAQIAPNADAILLLSLVSGRNPEYLIGKHVQSAFGLQSSGLEILPTGYILLDGGRETTVSYISGTKPIPADKPQIAAATALASTLLGQGIIYLDAGSGAKIPISKAVISHVRAAVNVPIIVGGGMKTSADINAAWDAGANVVVIGNALEEQPNLLTELRG
jgi:phosphoglycerol geranylgeranyltransferase